MRCRDFAIGLLLATGTQLEQAQQRAKQHRIATIPPALLRRAHEIIE